MLEWLNSITTGISLATITVSLWLGLFLVTRAGQSRRTWLAALTVWAVGSWFLYNVLQMSLPNYRELIWLLWFGQTIKFAPMLWFQLSYQLRLESGSLSQWQDRLFKAVILLAYLLTLYNIWDTSRYFGVVPFPGEIASYILFLLVLIVLPLWTMWNFYQSRAQTKLPLLRLQLTQLLIATMVAYMGGLYAGFAIYFKWDGPLFLSRAILGIGIILLGYGEVKYDSLLEGRSNNRDALYSSVGVGLVTLIYALVAWLLWVTGEATIPAVATILVIAVITHTLSDGGRAILDRLFYRGHERQLRTDLRNVALETSRGSTLAEQLQLVLTTICETIGVSNGFIAIRNTPSEGFVVTTSRDAHWRDHQFSAGSLAADDIVDLLASSQTQRPELESMALLLPLADWQSQIGALVLGNKVSGEPYQSKDFDYLETVGDQLAAMIVSAKQQETRVQELEQVIEEYLLREKGLQQQVQQLVAAPPELSAAPSDFDEERMTSLTEDALRHFDDYAYLGEHPFAKLALVERNLPLMEASGAVTPSQTVVTHLDLGRALHSLLVQTLEKLRPVGSEPAGLAVPGRDWYNYIILHDSYVEGVLTRDIMGRLYISEGTYGRTRRRALRSVAKMIQEMESQAQANHQKVVVEEAQVL